MRRGARGFTLIELLVVLGIIAVLFAVVLVAVNPGRRFAEARNARRQSDVRSILEASLAYTVDNRGTPPPYLPPTSTCIGTGQTANANGGREVDPSRGTDGTSLSALWHLNGDANDTNPTAPVNNGTASGGVSWVSAGRLGQSLSLDGSTGQVLIPDDGDAIADPDLDLAGDFTLMAWVKPTAAITADKTIITKGAGVTRNYFMRLVYDTGGSGNVMFRCGLGNGTSSILRTTTTLYPVGTWVHIACVVSGTTFSIFVNGSSAASGGFTGPPSVNTNPIYFGRSNTGTEWFTGELDEVVLYGRALGQPEIQTYATQCYDLTPSLIPSYLAAMPKDPASGTDPDTGYTIRRDPAGPITIRAAAPEAVGGTTPDISVSR